MKTAYDIIIRPIVTEMTSEDFDILKYFFEVDPHANKVEIAKAIEEIFGVTVIKVTTSIVKGKPKQQGRSRPGYTKTWKKACVKLSVDSKPIEIFENMA